MTESETRQELIKHLQNYVDNKGFNISFVSLGYAEKLLEQMLADEKKNNPIIQNNQMNTML